MQVPDRYIIFLSALLFCISGFAQKPPATQPANDDNFLHIPTLKQGQKPEDFIKSNIFLRVSSSKNQVFTGEPFLVEYEYYTDIPSEPSPGTEPTFNGCSVVELSGLHDTDVAIIGGKRFHVIAMRKVQLTPLQDGPLVLSEASVNNVVQLITPDDPMHVKDFSYVASSTPITITVKPLPDENKPSDFSGLVGQFIISAKTDSSSVAAGENTRLTIMVKGTGNIEALSMPTVTWPDGVHHYDASDTEIVQKDTFPANNSKLFAVPIICTLQGHVVIPPVSLSYFDPFAQKYFTIHSNSVALKITPPVPKQKPEDLITPATGNSKYLWIVAAIAFCVIAVLLITITKQRKQKKKAALLRETASKPTPIIIADKPLPINFFIALQMVKLKPTDHEFYVAAKELLMKALQQKLGVTVFHEADILRELKQTLLGETVSSDSSHIFTACNQAAYSPMGDAQQRIEVFEMLSDVIAKLGV